MLSSFNFKGPTFSHSHHGGATASVLYCNCTNFVMHHWLEHLFLYCSWQKGNSLSWLQLSYGWGMVILFHVNFSLMIHTVSIWLTLSLAIWRYIMIKYHSLAQVLSRKIELTINFMKFIFRVSARSADVRLSCSWAMVSLNRKSFIQLQIIYTTLLKTTLNTDYILLA